MSVDIVIIPRPYVLIFEACQARLQLTCCKIIISSGMFNDPKDVTAKIKIQQEPTAATSARPPNILYLVLDQWRYDWDGHHPDTPTGPLPLNVPFLWDMGQRSTRFTQAYVPSPYCAPVRACFASGMEYDATGIYKNLAHSFPLDRIQMTIYKLLRDTGGYHTMICGKDDLYPADDFFPKYPNDAYAERKMDLGFSDAIRQDGKMRIMKNPPAKVPNRFEEPYRMFLDSQTVTMLDGTELPARQAYIACHMGRGPEEGCDASSFPDELYPDNFVRDRAIDLLNRKPKDKPWFMQVNFPGPHHPIATTSKMAESVIDREWPLPFNAVKSHPMNDCPQQDQKREHPEMTIIPPQLEGRCNYAAEIENLDMLMNAIVQRVADMGEFDNTIIVVAGDHGEMLGENGHTGKGTPWRGSVTTPLFISGPGIGQEQVYHGPVTTLDLGATFLDFAGINQLAPGMTTTSLRYLLESEGDTVNQLSPSLSARPYVSSGYDYWRMVVKDMPTSPDDPIITSYKLICCKARLCKDAPKSATPYKRGEPWHVMLYDTVRDPYDDVPLDQARPDIIQELLPLLPEGWCR